MDDYRCGHCDNDVATAAAGPHAAAAEPTLRVGEEVSHGTYGRGVVVALEGARAEVHFGGHGVHTVRNATLRSAASRVEC